jgi:hypothetical protein
MKLATTLLILCAMVSACSSSSSDRRGSIDERQERIANERTPTPAQNRDQLYGPGAPEPVENDFDRDGDGISDADETNAEPDNTALNERDENALTPIDQSNDSSDIEITQAIRKKVVGDDELSFNAKNVKIITVGGKVTLRGPVESPNESASIERSARDVAGVTKVDNQLEVK